VVYSTEGQGRTVSSCRRLVRRPGRRRHEGFLPLQRSPSRIGLDRTGAESADRPCPYGRLTAGVKDGLVCSRLLKLVPQPHLHPNLASRVRPRPSDAFQSIRNLRQYGPAADGVENTWRSSSIQQPRLSCRSCRQPGTADCAERPHDNDRVRKPRHMIRTATSGSGCRRPVWHGGRRVHLAVRPRAPPWIRGALGPASPHHYALGSVGTSAPMRVVSGGCLRRRRSEAHRVVTRNAMTPKVHPDECRACSRFDWWMRESQS